MAVSSSMSQFFAAHAATGKGGQGMICRPPSAGNPRSAPFVKLWKTLGSQLYQRFFGHRQLSPRKHRRATSLWAAVVFSGLIVGGLVIDSASAPSRSTTIALTSDETRLVVVNREANTLSIIQVKDASGNDVDIKLAEIGVGQEPRCVAVHPTDQAAYVTNALTGTVSVVDLVLGKVAKEVRVGTEPRGCALTPDGSLLYVANHTEGTVSIFVVPSGNPLNPILDGAVQVGRNPTAIAITDKGTGNISDDTVFVTQIFAELNPDFVDPIFNGNGEARDLGKQGVVHAFPAGNANPPITKITLKPLTDSGFSANRVSPNNFCNTVPPAQSNIFCPNPDDPTSPANTNNPQGVFPNQLLPA